MLRYAVALLRHRVTWRFLAVLLTTIGYASLAGNLGELEVALCSVLSCVD